MIKKRVTLKVKKVNKRVGKQTAKNKKIKRVKFIKKIATKNSKKRVKVYKSKLYKRTKKRYNKKVTKRVYKFTKKRESKRVDTPIIKGVSKSAFLSTVRAKIKANLVYPEPARVRHIEGSATVLFDISKYGKLENIRILRAKRVFRRAIKSALRSASPVVVPLNLKSYAPFNDIYLPLNFKIN